MPDPRPAPTKGPNQCTTPGCCRKNLLPISTLCAAGRREERERQEQSLPPETPRA